MSVQLLLIDHWSDRYCRIFRVSIFERLHVRDEMVNELIVDFCMDDDAIGAHTNLTLMQESAYRARTHRVLQIRVVENNARAVPSQFQGDALYLRRCDRQFADMTAYLGRACKRDQLWNWMERKRIPDHFRRTDHNVEQSCRKACFFEYPSDK
jgi:hypothetical protein